MQSHQEEQAKIEDVERAHSCWQEEAGEDNVVAQNAGSKNPIVRDLDPFLGADHIGAYFRREVIVTGEATMPADTVVIDVDEIPRIVSEEKDRFHIGDIVNQTLLLETA